MQVRKWRASTRTRLRMRVYTYLRGMRVVLARPDDLRIGPRSIRVSARTTASAGDCTRPRVPGYLFGMSRANGFGYLRMYRCC